MKKTRDVLRGSHRDFLASYARKPSDAELVVERDVYGMNAGITSYTTPEQADELANSLDLKAGMRVLEVGAGTGWPSVYLAARRGCRFVLTDVPVPGLRAAIRRATSRDARRRVHAVAATGSDLPFASCSFDAVLHCDVLC